YCADLLGEERLYALTSSQLNLAQAILALEPDLEIQERAAAALRLDPREEIRGRERRSEGQTVTVDHFLYVHYGSFEALAARRMLLAFDGAQRIQVTGDRRVRRGGSEEQRRKQHDH